MALARNSPPKENQSADTQLAPELMARVRQIQVRTRRLVSDVLSGAYRSTFRGSGVEFEEVRPYQPGDDVRSIDWNRTARSAGAFVKTYVEERELTLLFLVDTSRSMDFGAKFDFARRFAASVAYVGLINHDRVSVVGFADGVLQEMPARRGKNQLWRTLHFLERMQAAGRTSLQSALRGFFGARRSRGLVVLISDFLDRNGFEPAFQVIREFRHEVFAVHVVSPEERDPVIGDDVVLIDSEEGAATEARVSADLLAAYRDTFARYCTEIEGFCRSHGWDLGFATVAGGGTEVTISAPLPARGEP